MLTHIPCCAIILPCFSKSVNISFSLVSSHGRYIISQLKFIPVKLLVKSSMRAKI